MPRWKPHIPIAEAAKADFHAARAGDRAAMDRWIHHLMWVVRGLAHRGVNVYPERDDRLSIAFETVLLATREFDLERGELRSGTFWDYCKKKYEWICRNEWRRQRRRYVLAQSSSHRPAYWEPEDAPCPETDAAAILDGSRATELLDALPSVDRDFVRIVLGLDERGPLVPKHAAKILGSAWIATEPPSQRYHTLLARLRVSLTRNDPRAETNPGAIPRDRRGLVELTCVTCGQVFAMRGWTYRNRLARMAKAAKPLADPNAVMACSRECWKARPWKSRRATSGDRSPAVVVRICAACGKSIVMGASQYRARVKRMVRPDPDANLTCSIRCHNVHRAALRRLERREKNFPRE